MARYYSAPAPTTKKAAGSQPQFLMALELYIDQPKVISYCRRCHLLIIWSLYI
jgi:hypothetical protein